MHESKASLKKSSLKFRDISLGLLKECSARGYELTKKVLKQKNHRFCAKNALEVVLFLKKKCVFFGSNDCEKSKLARISHNFAFLSDSTTEAVLEGIWLGNLKKSSSILEVCFLLLF